MDTDLPSGIMKGRSHKSMTFSSEITHPFDYNGAPEGIFVLVGFVLLDLLFSV
jgi:hypothetical protein